MKRTLGILLIVLGIALGIYGFTKMEDSGGDIQIGDLEISAQDQSKQNQAYIMMGIGGVGLIAGLVLVSSKRQ